MNSGGGIYGRKLVVGKIRDDQFFNDEQQVKASLAQDNAFATFVAAPLFGGAPDLAATNPPMPTFIWNINPEMEGHPQHLRNGRRAVLQLHHAGLFVPRADDQVHEGRDPRLRQHRLVEGVRDRHAGEFPQVPRRRKSSTSTTTSRPPGRPQHSGVGRAEGGRRPADLHVHRPDRVGDPRQGAGEGARGCRAEPPPTRTTRSS